MLDAVRATSYTRIHLMMLADALVYSKCSHVIMETISHLAVMQRGQFHGFWIFDSLW
jgi:hypothetical protein